MRGLCRWLLLTMAALSLAGCERSKPYQSLSREAAAQQRETGRVDFSKLEIGWDRLYLFPPYATGSEVEGSLGVPWSDYAKSAIGFSDGVSLVIFMKDHQVIRWFDHPRNQGDLAPYHRKEGYGRDEAIFPPKA